MRGKLQRTESALSAAATLIPALGVYVAAREDNTGAQITQAAPNSIAAQAGLHPDDLINAVNGAQIKTPTQLASVLSGISPGSTVLLGYLIHGQWQAEKSVIIGSHSHLAKAVVRLLAKRLGIGTSVDQRRVRLASIPFQLLQYPLC